MCDRLPFYSSSLFFCEVDVLIRVCTQSDSLGGSISGELGKHTFWPHCYRADMLAAVGFSR